MSDAADLSGWFTDEEGEWYAGFARPVVDGLFVEVGSWKGRSTSWVGPVCNRNRTRLVCVDHWAGSTDRNAADYAALLAAEDVRETFERNMRLLGVEVEVLAQASVAAAEQFAPATVDRVFLDASHDALAVREDLDAWFPRVKPDGVLAGHDYSAKQDQVRRTVDAFARDYSLSVERGPGSIFWLTC